MARPTAELAACAEQQGELRHPIWLSPNVSPSDLLSN